MKFPDIPPGNFGFIYIQISINKTIVSHRVFPSAESSQVKRMHSYLLSCCFLRPSFFLLFLLLFSDCQFCQDLLQRFNRFRFLPSESFEINVLDKLWKRSFPRLLLVIVYLAKLVRVQTEFTGYVKLYITRVMETYKLCKVQVTNLNQILKYLYF